MTMLQIQTQAADILGQVNGQQLVQTAQALQLSPEQTFVILQNLAMFIVGIAIYSLVIFYFYRYIAKRDFLVLDLSRYEGKRFGLARMIIPSILYIVRYVLIVPVTIFASLLILSGLLLLLSRTTNVANVLLMSMAIIGAVRVTAYVNKDLSKDLAKLLPFALLGVFIIDATFFNPQAAIDALTTELGNIDLWVTLTYYFAFIVALEFAIRILHLIGSKLFFRQPETKIKNK